MASRLFGAVLLPQLTICPALPRTGRGWVGTAMTGVNVLVGVLVRVAVLVTVLVAVLVTVFDGVKVFVERDAVDVADRVTVLDGVIVRVVVLVLLDVAVLVFVTVGTYPASRIMTMPFMPVQPPLLYEPPAPPSPG